MEYIHKEKQTIISEAFYNALKKTEKKNYQPYYGEDADDGTSATVPLNDLLGDETDESDMDFLDNDNDFDFGGGSGGGAGASDDF